MAAKTADVEVTGEIIDLSKLKDELAEEGELAFFNHIAFNDCPYINEFAHIAWKTGWLEGCRWLHWQNFQDQKVAE